MHVYDESSTRRKRVSAYVNWSRELTFSDRQINCIRDNVPEARGVYAVYAKDHLFPYSSVLNSTRRWSSLIYIGCGQLSKRLTCHLARKKNDVLEEYLRQYDLAYRYALIVDNLDNDWSRVVEASLLHLFSEKFGMLPPANRRRETVPELGLHTLYLRGSMNFSVLRRG